MRVTHVTLKEVTYRYRIMQVHRSATADIALSPYITSKSQEHLYSYES